MQPDQDQNNNWQQPKESAPQAPYETVDESDYNEDLGDSREVDDVQGEKEAQTVDDTVLLRWNGTEYLHQERSVLWYVVVAIVAIAFIIIALWWFQSVTFAILVPVMLVALVIYVRRPPTTLHYILSRKGLHVDDRLFPYAQFKSFSIVEHNGHHSVALIPRKRFQIGQTIYFPEEIGEQLVDMLAARLPMKEIKVDLVDRLLARLHL